MTSLKDDIEAIQKMWDVGNEAVAFHKALSIIRRLEAELYKTKCELIDAKDDASKSGKLVCKQRNEIKKLRGF